ncbi:galactose-1-phosphate uridylyltransferase [Candidatus Sulfurimonas baltica]|uniref:Galactose-1-phosphate uridylyltransferase n=1 Tax=Candidatus Sulfurimonas baltica TaxID=2740404 RepID=A0A7S7LUX7_9BACT|nr:galactose-1-phosphate uridylyltransferase [Candidatus Sulfurimonas baltica]
MSEIRLDRMHNQYVLIAPERLRRPDLLAPIKLKKLHQRCPFCEGNEALTPSELFAMRDNSPNSAGWKTRVIPNLYKAVQIELEDKSKRESMFESIPGVGAHEVLIDSPCHDCSIEGADPQSIENWLRSMIIRVEDLRKDKRLVHLSIFKNFGSMAGATQEHPHTQILALPIMPQNEIVFLERNMKYYSRHGRGMVEDILQNEISAKDRIVSEIGSFVAFCPYASSFPFEIMIAPKRNIACLEQCTRDEISDLSVIIKEVFQKLSSQLGSFNYNLYFRLAPLNSNFENESYMSYLNKNYRFTIRITPRIYRLGGFEIATGMAINPVSPEECVKLFNNQEYL